MSAAWASNIASLSKVLRRSNAFAINAILKGDKSKTSFHFIPVLTTIQAVNLLKNSHWLRSRSSEGLSRKLGLSDVGL